MEIVMEEKILFQDALKKIEANALKKDRILTIEEIDTFFAEMDLSREQMELVYDYLNTKKITIRGYESKKNIKEGNKSENPQMKSKEGEEDTDARQNILNLYLDEMETVSFNEIVSEKEMLFRAIEGDGAARSFLTNHNLKLVVKISKRYQDNGVELSDLIQEGNVALMLAMDKLNGMSLVEDHELETFHEYLADEITRAVLEVIAMEEVLSSGNEEILNKMNEIHEVAKTLTEEMGKTVSANEIAEYLHMEPEEIEEIMHLSVENLSIKEEHNHKQ